MNFCKITVERFRNLSDVFFSPSPGVNVIWGDNAQGKTNFLEALWLFTGAKSFRGAKEAEMVPFGAESASVSSQYEGGGRVHEASYRFGADKGQKKILLNGVSRGAFSGLVGSFYAAVFSPAHLTLVKGGPPERRRFIDLAICQLKPRYHAVLSQYGRLLYQRNCLMRDARLSSVLLDTLEIWEGSLAKSAALITRTRKSYLERLGEFAGEIYSGISSGRETLSIAYHGTADGEDEEAFRRAFRASRAQDLKTGSTSVGPHRDDAEFAINGLLARAYASQGQQRSIVLSLKLAECAVIEETAGESPVVLLDDVMSELDRERRDYLLNRLGGRQIFITCCEPDAVAAAENGTALRIEGGRAAGLRAL